MRRALHKVHLTALGVNAIIGAGIFLIPGKLAGILGYWSPLMFLACGVALHFVASTFARLSQLTHRSGGPYLYAFLAFGPNIAFVVGWISWIGAVFSVSAVGNALSFYLGHFFSEPLSPMACKCVTSGVLLTFGVLNYFGVHYGGRAVVLLTILKSIPLAAIAFVGLKHVSSGMLTAPLPALSHSGFSAALLMTLFTCQGFEVVPILAGETRKPADTIPFSIITSLWITTVLYFLIQTGLSVGPAVGSEKPLADQAIFLFGNIGGTLVALAGLVSVLGFVAGVALGAPRLLSPLSEDRLLPYYFAGLHPKFHTPTRAILLTTGLSIGFAVFSEMTALIDLAALTVALQYFVSALALIRLVQADEKRIAKSAILALIVAGFFLFQVPAKSWLTFAIVVGFGGVMRFLYTLQQRNLAGLRESQHDLQGSVELIES